MAYQTGQSDRPPVAAGAEGDTDSSASPRWYRGRFAWVVGAALGVLGLGLITIGVLNYSSASSAKDDADALEAERQELEAEQATYVTEVEQINAEAEEIIDQNRSVASAFDRALFALQDAGEAESEVFPAFDEALSSGTAEVKGIETLNTALDAGAEAIQKARKAILESGGGGTGG